MSRKGKYKRAYLVDGRYQLGQMAVEIASNVLVALAIAALLSWFYLLEWDGSVAYDHNRRIPVYLLAFVLITVLTASFFSLRRSRSIAGMMKKLHSVLDNAARGVFPEGELAFRKSDYYGHLAAPLNSCLRQLQQKKGTDAAQAVDELRGLAARIEKREIDEVEIVRCADKRITKINIKQRSWT